MTSAGGEPSIAAMRGLGPASAAMLARAGIDSAARLRQLGAVRAFVMVRGAGCAPSLNLLWALEGALSGATWQEVAREHRTSLLLALEAQDALDAPAPSGCAAAAAPPGPFATPGPAG